MEDSASLTNMWWEVMMFKKAKRLYEHCGVQIETVIVKLKILNPNYELRTVVSLSTFSNVFSSTSVKIWSSSGISLAVLYNKEK